MKRICVYCGSSPGGRPEYVQAARELGRVLADRNIGLVYGGGNVGLMGELARTVLAANGEVIGVIPTSLAQKEVALTQIADLRLVNSMHERKALMADLADGFIALPGGLGTFEEFFEVITWAQLGLHAKPCGLLNVSQFYAKLIAFVDYAVQEQFIRPEYRAMILVDETPQTLLQKFAAYQPPQIDKARIALELLKTIQP
ncbi:MAG: TIGR00730 family Rossman fold protein [Anaerolineae bacterium]|nr:TIGR00730 family Rossman fold protein [Anaerolineae bacterium]